MGALLPALLALLLPAASAVHYPDSGDGSYSNPVMMNAHWSDPDIVRVGNEYLVVSSSTETCPNLQILRSLDLVNWDVVGSVLRFWPTTDPNQYNSSIRKAQCWSPRIMHINGRLRVMWHATGDHFMVAEAVAPAGPWGLVRHNLTQMSGKLIAGECDDGRRPHCHTAGPQWAATTFVDDDGKTYIYANNWIQECDAAALSWVGPRVQIADPGATGVGLMENPSLMKRGDWYYWHESSNGTVTWGLSPDPNGGAGSTNKGALSVWRSKNITGPYEGPRHVIKSNLDFSCVNTGSLVLGPDNVSWYYVYDAIEVRRWNLERQMMLDKVEFGADDWPKQITPSRRRPMPVGVDSAASRSVARWRPDLSDEFNGSTLEGITMGVLGRKWLFKQEDPSLWSLENGALILKTNCSGIDTFYSENMLVQRPTSSYFTIDTKLNWVGSCGMKGRAAPRPGEAARGRVESGADSELTAAEAGLCDHVENDTDYMSGDILPDDRMIFLPNASACCAACRSYTGRVACSHWSYITHSGHDGPDHGCVPNVTCGRCYFKTTDEGRVKQNGVVSGHVMGRAGFNATGSGSAGIIAREFNSGSSAAIGVYCDATAGGLRLALWQDMANLIWASPTTVPISSDIFLKLDIDLVRAQAWWRLNETAPWVGFDGGGTSSGRYTATRLMWELVHAGPSPNQWPSAGVPTNGGGGEGGALSTANEYKQADSFTTFHPGLWAGGGSHAGNAARFEYWRFTDNEIFAT